ncbi:uncharacterized protein LOC122274569 [Carya illinoinensis]|uniref:uncharacterized protein LOC122274569 n=1 Tax=Carya illinoinensis TaxID=32201 RepID=UPI001C7186FE|nr:uncharacterized protein LOC122274569 [Carya illinoinensis]
MWVKHEAFMDCVADSWEKGMEERGMARLVKKLKKMKSTLRGWNKEVFGAMALNIRLSEDRVGKLENKMQEGFNEEDEQDYLVAKIELNTWLEREETRLRQQAKLSWLEKEEASASFFRACNARSKMQVNEMRLPDGKWLKSSEEIHDEAVQYFSHFLAHKQVGVLPDLSNLVQTVVIEEDNERLCQLPSIQDVRDAVFSIPVNSSPGPDGFGSGFFQACWHIVGNDVVEAVQEFFLGADLPMNFAASFMTLIPKVELPTNFGKFRPISLCLTFYKICSKILVSRLAPMLPRIIAPEQGAFISGRSIFDNISLIQELVHSINKPVRGGNIILKLDIAKAYDSVDWNFLLHVMSHFGFSGQVCDLIRKCISNAHFSIVMNGVLKGFFKSGRGLRQGDPISPYLFIMVKEILSRLLKAKFEEKKIGVFVQPRGTPLISHLLYADDIVIFANGSKASVRAILDVLSTYEQWSGQNVRKVKSSITFSKYITRLRRRSILRITGFVEGKTPFKYLGVPIISGRMKTVYLEEIVEKIKARLEGWKNKLLANGAPVLLLKHVLMSLPIYLLSTVYVPGSVMKSINRCLSNFFWGVHEGKPKKHWKSWDKLCLPAAEGGMGFRKFTDIQKSLFLKFAWKIMVEDSLWSNFFRAKYVRQNHISLVERGKGTRFWRMVASCMPDVLNLSKWKIKNGNISFWFDKWLDEGPLCNLVPMGDSPSLLVTECKMENGWDAAKLHGTLGAELTEKVLEVLSKSRAGSDVLVWTASNDGKFSTKSAWNCVRINAPKVRWADWVWHPCIPKNILVNMWKVFNNALSVDDKIRSIGIPIASKCDCCLNGGYENRDHVLANGDIAKEVWRLAYAQMGLGRTTGISWNQIVEEWLTKASKSSQLGHLLGIIPSTVTWSPWLRCCKARAKGIKDSAITVWYNIKTWIAKVGEKLKVGKMLSSRDQKILMELNIPVKLPKRLILKLVRWTKPTLGRLKLNVDGSSNGNPGAAGAGGVLRDSKGDLLMSFSVHLGTGTSNFAEVMSLIHGLRLIKRMGVVHIDLESDSMMVIQATLRSLRSGVSRTQIITPVILAHYSSDWGDHYSTTSSSEVEELGNDGDGDSRSEIDTRSNFGRASSVAAEPEPEPEPEPPRKYPTMTKSEDAGSSAESYRTGEISSDNMKMVVRHKDLKEIVEAIRENFENAAAAGDQVSEMLEIGRAQLDRSFRQLKKTVYHSSNVLSNLSSNWTSKPPLAVKYRIDGSLDEPGGPKSLCSTLERLLAWEKKLYEEVKCLVKKDREDVNDPTMAEFYDKLVTAYRDPGLMSLRYSRSGTEGLSSPLLQAAKV